MIKLDIQSVILIYVGVFLVSVIGLWVFSANAPRLKVKKTEGVYIWKCGICSHRYIDSKNEDMSVCPVCGSYNKRDSA